MAEQKESSVLFNLRELMNLEEDRVKEEADKKKKAEDDARMAKEADERKKREAEEARARAEEEVRQADERRRRDEEAARIRAKEEAELRVRLEAEQKARAAEQERLLAHEQEVKRIEATRRKGVHPAILVVGVLALLGAGAGVYFGVIKPQQEAAELQARRHRQEAERAAAEA